VSDAVNNAINVRSEEHDAIADRFSLRSFSVARQVG